MISLDRPVLRIASASMSDERARALIALLDQPGAIDSALALLALTDPVARAAAGLLTTLPPQDRYQGQHARFVMLPFIQPRRGRFNDATFGAWYAGTTARTAYEEKLFHLTRWLRNSSGKPYDVRQMLFSASITDPLHDVSLGTEGVAEIVYDPDPERYDAANALARERRDAGAHGLYASSVRDTGGHCVAIYRPAALVNVELEREIHFEWDGATLRGFEALDA